MDMGLLSPRGAQTKKRKKIVVGGHGSYELLHSKINYTDYDMVFEWCEGVLHQEAGNR